MGGLRICPRQRGEQGDIADGGELLVANPLNRYLVNSQMLPNLKLDADVGLTLLIQNLSPGKDKEANWLPVPNGPFFMVMRLYSIGRRTKRWKAIGSRRR